MKTTRPITLPMCHGGKLVIDLFAGGGGWSTGIEQAFRAAGSPRLVDIAVNHNPVAIACHKANHPQTIHYTENVYKLWPLDATGGLPVGYLHASPDCTHHSKARGGKPVKKYIRGLAWVVTRWARLCKPDIITLENVEEFKDWGPLDADGKPDKMRKGQTFATWRECLRRLGYTMEFKEQVCSHFGAPTSRKRLFMILARDPKHIIWPAKSHGASLVPVRTAAECIDWNIPACSIFASKREAREWAKRNNRKGVPQRPLKPNTLRRIANGVMRYVINSKKPFVVTCNHDGVGFRGQPLDMPMGTITGARDAHGVVQPVLQRASEVAAFISKHYTGVDGHPLGRPLGTITSIDHHALTTAVITRIGQTKFSADPSKGADTPLSTIVSKQEHMLATAHMIKLRGTCADGQPVDQPAPTICGGGTHAGLVLAFLQKYYGQGGQDQDLNGPLHTIPGVDRFGLVTVHIGGEDWVITDICMRMLTPAELARCQGFPADYILDRAEVQTKWGIQRRRLTSSEQVKLIGNSVPPQMAAAIVSACVVPILAPAKVKATKRARQVA